MSKPKPTVGSVKRRGLVIATAVAVAGSGIVSVNYVSAQETGDDLQETNNSLAGSTESDGRAEESQAGAPEALTRQADTGAVSLDSQEQAEPVESETTGTDKSKTPTAESVLDEKQEGIKSELQATKDPESVAVKIAKQYESSFDTGEFGAFERKLVRQVKQYFNKLAASGVITFEEEAYSLPAPEAYFTKFEQAIASDLRKPDGKPNKTIDNVVEQHIEKLASTHNFGTDNAKAKWKAEFRELVDKKEKSVFAEYYTPTAKAYFESREKSIVADFRSPEGQNALKYLERAFDEAEKAGIMPVGEDQKAEWKEEFRTLVQNKEDAVIALQKAEAYAQLGTIAEKNPVQADIFKKQIDESVDPNELAKLLAATKAEKKNPVKPFATTNDHEPSVEDAPEVEEDKPSKSAEPASPVVAKALENAKKKASAIIEDAQHLSAGQKSAYKGAVEAASSLRQVEGLLASALTTAELQEDEQLYASQLSDVKEAATEALEGAAHLSDEQKNAYKGAVEAATSPEQIELLMDGALETNDLQADNSGGDSEATESADEHRGLVEDELGKNSNPDFFPNTVEGTSENFAHIFAQNADKVLLETKKEALDSLQASEVNPAQREIFRKQIEDTDSLAVLHSVLKAIEAKHPEPFVPQTPKPELNQPGVEEGTESGIESEASPSLMTQVLAKAKGSASDILKTADWLTPEQHQAFAKQIDEAGSLVELETIIAQISTEEAASVGKHRGVIESVLEANANSVEDPNKAALTAEDLAFPFAQHRDEVAEDLIEAKRAGVAAVDGARHLSDEQKTAYKAAIEAAASDSQIDELVYAALDASDLEAGYAKIFEQLGLNENPGFSPNEKKWTSEDFANSFKQHAANEESKDLQEVRDAGSAAVDGIHYLTKDQKSAFKKQIAAAGSEDAVSEIVFAALDLADKQGAQEAGQDTVAAEKSRVLKAIGEFSNLTDQQKADFKKKVDEANTVAYLQVLGEMAAQLNVKQGEQAGAPEQKPSDDTISEDTETPAKPSSEFGFSNFAKGLFGATAILGVIGIVFGGVAHAIKHFPGFEHVQNQVRETLAKFGIRF